MSQLPLGRDAEGFREGNLLWMGIRFGPVGGHASCREERESTPSGALVGSVHSACLRRGSEFVSSAWESRLGKETRVG